MPRRTWLRLLDPEIHELKLHAAAGSAADRLKLAKAFNARCRHEEACDILDALLAENRADGDAWFERIVAEGDHGAEEDLASMHGELEALRDENPQDATPRRNLGYVRILQHRPNDAERALRQALDRDAQDPRSLELMGLLNLQRDEPAEAKAWLLKALSLNPRSSRTLRLLGIADEQLEDQAGAEAQFVAALDADPAYFWGWHSLGEMLFKQGDLEPALRCVNRARSLQAREPASYFIVSALCAEQGHMEMAQAEMHKLLLLSPPSQVLCEAYCILGELRRDLDDRENATSYFSLAAETDPASAAPWTALGDLAREEDRLEDALRCYREALEREPEAADILVQLGYVLLKTGKALESERSFLTALEADPSEYSAYLGLSECYRQLKRPSDQMAMVKQAMALAPEDPDVWNAQGVALEVNGHLTEATEAYEKALNLAPLHRKAANNLGFLLEKRMEAGEPELRERAVEAWKRRLLICRDEGQSLKMAKEHLQKLGVPDATLHRWMERESTTS